MIRDRNPNGLAVDRRRLALPVLHASDHELVVVKPAGMASQLTSDPHGRSLLSRVKSAIADPRAAKLPHRLDRVTRGILVVALSDEAIRFHNASIRGSGWTKLYLARVRAPSTAGWERLMGTHRVHLRVRRGRAEVVRSGGKRAITEIAAAAPTPDRRDEAHLLLRLHTGRYHQIRATLAELGVPLVGDWLYGPRDGESEDRFYLEHVALRFPVFAGDRPLTAHWRDDPERDPIDAAMRAAIDDRLAALEEDDAEER